MAKLHAYGFDADSLRMIRSYLVGRNMENLHGRKQRQKVDNEYSKWQEIYFGVRQGSISGLLLFNIHICDVLFAVKLMDIASYAMKL